MLFPLTPPVRDTATSKKGDMHVSTLDRPDYHSYLLRLWRDGTPPAWRAALHCTATEHVYHFVTVQAMMAFLALQLAGDDEYAQGPVDDAYPMDE